MEKTIVGLTGGEVFAINWKNSNNTTINVVVPAGVEEFLFVELGKDEYWNQIETLEEEVQTEEDIMDFMEYLTESGDAVVEYLGRVEEDHTQKKIQLASQTTSSIQSIIQHLDAIKASFTLQKEIRTLNIQSGDVLNVFTAKGELVSKERLVEKDGEFVLSPTKHEVTTSFEEEQMTREELNEYLFALVVEEGNQLVWETTFGDNKKKRLALSENKAQLEKSM